MATAVEELASWEGFDMVEDAIGPLGLEVIR